MLSDGPTLPEQERNCSGKKLTKPVYAIENSTSGKLVNGLLEYCYQVGPNRSSSSGDVVSTDTDGFVRLWRFLDYSTSGNGFQLSLVGLHKLFDHS